MIAPTVKARRGVPVTVTDSEKATVKVGVSTGLYVALLGAVTVLIVGTVWSIVTVFATVSVAGPVCEAPLETELAFKVKVTLPSEHEESVIVYVAPEPEIETVQLEEPLPLRVKSAGINPEMLSEKLSVYEILELFVISEDGEKLETVVPILQFKI